MPDHDDVPAPAAFGPARLAVVNWWYPDGSVAEGCPIDYDAAVALMQAYRDRFPERRAWLSVPRPPSRP